VLAYAAAPVEYCLRTAERKAEVKGFLKLCILTEDEVAGGWCREDAINT